MKTVVSLLAGLLAATSVSAQAPALKPRLQGLGFLVGRWSTPTPGKVAETGGGSTGEISFTPEASGAVLLRRDHVRLSDASGKPTGGFDILMMIYSEGGGVRADYADGDHVIHYGSASIYPGHAVIFTSAASARGPAFKLSYVLSRPDVLDISFSAAAPGGAGFVTLASGSATRER